uniref:B box-type domain-containing protein n=1 Tax=Nicotiana tabacum TaxID=4097 RepID=A0A1S4ABM9_TOBAC|nr:PREDICTED: uncharacterized protein LOC107795879 [Nicotiana tabacum]
MAGLDIAFESDIYHIPFLADYVGYLNFNIGTGFTRDFDFHLIVVPDARSSLEIDRASSSILPVGNGSISIPKWLEVLLSEKFFNACLVHELERKNEENVFCLDCCFSLCLHCLPSHHCHKLLQIRRYVYQDVLRLKEADKLLDCSFVQSYTTNSAKVVFLNQRPITRQFKNSLNYTCIVCDRSIQRSNLFCSISCKVLSISLESSCVVAASGDFKMVRTHATRDNQALVPLARAARARAPERAATDEPPAAPIGAQAPHTPTITTPALQETLA